MLIGSSGAGEVMIGNSVRPHELQMPRMPRVSRTLRLTSGGMVYYCRTYNWSRTGVATGATPVTTEFTVPLTVPAVSDWLNDEELTTRVKVMRARNRTMGRVNL